MHPPAFRELFPFNSSWIQLKCLSYFSNEHCCHYSQLVINYWVSQVMLVVKNLPANAGDVGDMSSIPERGRSHRGGHGNPL